MAVNRYTQVQWNNPISMYTPRPFQEMDAIGRRTQDQYDKGKQLPGIMGEIAAKLPAAPYHQDYKDKVINDYSQQMNSLIDKYHGNYGSPDFQIDANKLVSKFANDKDIQTIKQEGEAFKNYQEKYAQDPKNQRDLNFSLPNGQVDKGHLIKHGINVVPFAEHIKDASSFTEHIIPNSNAISSIKPYGEGYMYVLKNGEHQYIKPEEIQNIARQAVPSYAGTAGGDFRMKSFIASQMPELAPQLSKMNYDQIKGILGDQGGQVLDEYLAKDIEAQGQQKIHDQTKYTQGLHNDALAKDKFKNEQANLTTSTQSEGLNNLSINDITKNIEFDKNGNAIPPSGTDKLTTFLSKKLEEAGDIGLSDPNPSNYTNRSKEIITKTINTIKEQHPELRDLSDEKAVNAYRSAIKSLSSESIPLQSISNLASKGITDAIVRNKAQRNFYLYDSKGKTEDGTFQTVLDKLGIKEEEFDKQFKKNGIAGYTQAGPSAGSYYTEIKNDDGETRRVMISPDDQMKKIFSTSQAVNEARKTLAPQIVSPIPGVDYKVAVKPNISKDGKVHWDYMEVINGQPKHTTLEEIRKQEREALKESSYLGSQVQDTKDEEKDVE